MQGFLEPGEHVQLEARPHGLALAIPLARALALAVLGGALVVFGSPAALALGAIGAALLAAGAFLALAAVLRWDRTELVLTTEKLFVVHGVFRRRGAAVRLARIGPVEIDQTLFGHFFGYATVIAGELEVPYVPEARKITDLIGRLSR